MIYTEKQLEIKLELEEHFPGYEFLPSIVKTATREELERAGHLHMPLGAIATLRPGIRVRTSFRKLYGLIPGTHVVDAFYDRHNDLTFRPDLEDVELRSALEEKLADLYKAEPSLYSTE